MVIAAWNMRRITTAQVSLLPKADGEDPLTHPGAVKEAQRFLTLARQLESSYKSTRKELIDLQTARALKNLDDEMPPLARPEKIASFVKQTQAAKPRPNQSVAKQSQTPPPPLPAAKVGRSEPCPCGSGYKYKRFCDNPVTSLLANIALSTPAWALPQFWCRSGVGV